MAVRVKMSLYYGHTEKTTEVVIDVYPEWAPLGAKRFLELVDDKYMDGCKMYRVVPGFMVQWGINGDLTKYNKWYAQKIKDDPVKKSNQRGMLSFATSGPDARSCQIFINFGDNAGLDEQGFSPFAEVVSGMEHVDAIYDGYGESEPRGKGPNQGALKEQGEAYLKNFPKLTMIKEAVRA
jgi:peptidyl-prolyl cis-trans isomerase A (cyclophilin A)